MSWLTQAREATIPWLLVLAIAALSGGPAPAAAARLRGGSPAARAADAPAAQLTAVRFGAPGGISDAGVLIARERGFFRDQGLAVDVLPFQSGSDVIAPLAAGDLEVAGGTVSTGLFNAFDRGLGIKLVADKGTSRRGFEYSQLVVRRPLLDSGEVHDLADLRGRRIGVASVRSGSESVVAHILARGGVGIDEVDLVVLSFPEMIVALGNGAVDAAQIIEPLLSAAVDRGVAATWEPGRSSQAYGGVYQAGILLYSGQFAAEVDLARRFMLAYLQGVRVYNDAFARGEGRPEVVRILTEQTSVRDPSVYDRMEMAGLDPNGRIARQSLQLDLDYFRQRGYYTGSLALDDVVDASFADYAAQQLGPYP